MKCVVEMGSGDMICMKTGTAIQAILTFRLSSLRGCNVGITNGRDL
jgi:hypothetical protein